MDGNIFGIITIISGVIMTLAILLQSRGASLGAGFGSTGELFTTRRGVDKNLFELTIVLAVVFVGSLVVSLIVT
ncbi:MAG TPA: preprotein translocase subunit SecG [Candidatus Saccharimonadales bacterium]|nr:preprotein translocase subunit SecG [Candidatus Saccharimonadales bacterium]